MSGFFIAEKAGAKGQDFPIWAADVLLRQEPFEKSRLPFALQNLFPLRF
jgi:hypothetical protein